MHIGSIEALVAAMSANHTHYLDLQQSTLRREVRAQAQTSFLVWRTHTAGCLVVSGTVELPRHGVLLLTGHGARFRDVTFTGAAFTPAP